MQCHARSRRDLSKLHDLSDLVCKLQLMRIDTQLTCVIIILEFKPHCTRPNPLINKLCGAHTLYTAIYSNTQSGAAFPYCITLSITLHMKQRTMLADVS